MRHQATSGDITELPLEYRAFRLVSGNRMDVGFVLWLRRDDNDGKNFYILYYSDLKSIPGSTSGELVLRTYDYEFTIKGRHFDMPIQVGPLSGLGNTTQTSISLIEALRLQKVECLREWGKEFRDVPETEPRIDSIEVKKIGD